MERKVLIEIAWKGVKVCSNFKEVWETIKQKRDNIVGIRVDEMVWVDGEIADLIAREYWDERETGYKGAWVGKETTVLIGEDETFGVDFTIDDLKELKKGGE